MKEEIVVYKYSGMDCKGYFAYDAEHATRRPAVLVAHAWRGQDDFAREKARALAELGYIGFAADVYGQGQTATTNERAQALMLPLFIERKVLRDRIVAAYEAMRAHPLVDTSRLGAIGFCFGGMTVIELLRSGVDLKGVVSFHGLFGPKVGEISAKMHPPAPQLKGSFLALHGYDDPFNTKQDLLNFQEELTKEKVDWQMHIYGNTVHAFTNPMANDTAGGMVYNPFAASRSWQAMRNFFEERFKLGKE